MIPRFKRLENHFINLYAQIASLAQYAARLSAQWLERCIHDFLC